MGHVVEKIDVSKFNRVFAKASAIYEKENIRFDNLVGCTSFMIMSKSKTVLDILDPIIGFIIPEVGDTLSAIASAPSLYFAIFKAKNLKLTMAILYYIIVDWLVGLIPVLGDIADAFYLSHKKTYKICVGFIEEDPNMQREINKAVISLILLVAILGTILYFAYEFIITTIEWFSSLI